MDFVAQSGLDISHSGLISGVTNTSADEEILTLLRAYGALQNVLTVSDPKSSFYKNLITKFEEASASVALKSLLPYTYTSCSAADRVFCGTALARK